MNVEMTEQLAQRVLERAKEIQQIASPTFGEAQRAAFVQAQFVAEGLVDVRLDQAGNVYGRLPGKGGAGALVVSAHLDTVFPLDTPLELRYEEGRLYGPGIGDNSLGVAGLFGLLWALQAAGTRLPGDLWLVANTGEEGLGDLKGMRALVEHFGASPQAYIILEGMSLGQIYHRALGVERYRISAHTRGGHSWVDYGSPSAVHELAGLVTRLAALSLPARPRSSLNVGVFNGGTTINTIAAEASLELDLRSESPRALAELAARVLHLVRQSDRPGVEFTVEIIGRRPAGQIPAGHPLVRLARRSLEAQGLQVNLGIGSTDANIPLSQGLPAVCVGLTTGGGAHTRQEYILTAPLRKGLSALLALVERAHQLPPHPRRPAARVKD